MQVVIGALAIVALVFMFKYKLNLGWIMLVGSLLVAVATRMSVSTAADTLFKALTSRNTLGTIVILFLVAVIENIMRKTGMLNSLAENMQSMFRGKMASTVMMPIMLGMLPSAGGARFSCPMVGEMLQDDTDALDKSYINYWYRHVWLDGFVLFPGVILASRLTDFSVTSIFAHLMLFSPFYILCGLSQVRGLLRKKAGETGRRAKPNAKALFKFLFPIILVLGIYILLIRWTAFALEISCAVTVLYLILASRYKGAELKKTVIEAFNVKYIILIAGVMVFSEFINSSGIMRVVIEAVLRFSFPVLLLYVLLPFIAGYGTGMSTTYVAIVFPILIPLGLTGSIWLITLAYLSGFLGIMVSPVHLCGIMSADYFEVKYKSVLNKVVIAALYMAGASALLFLFIRSIVHF